MKRNSWRENTLTDKTVLGQIAELHTAGIPEEVVPSQCFLMGCLTMPPVTPTGELAGFHCSWE